MSLTIKFSLFIVLLVFIVLSTVTVVLVRVRRNEIQQELVEKDKITSVLLARELSDNFADYYFYQYDTYRDFVKKKLINYGDVVHFTMYNTNGEILFDSKELEKPPGSTPITPQKVQRPEILTAIAAKAQKNDIVVYNSENTIRFMQPYIDKFDVYRNMFEIEFSMNDIQQSIQQTIIFYTEFLGLFTVFSLVISYLLFHQITKPIKILTKATEQFSAGNLDIPVTVNSSDEIGILAKSFNKMAADLKSSHQILKQHNQTLEAEVAKRTKELTDKIGEMERLQNITIDRELKMVEMKKELESLKAKA